MNKLEQAEREEREAGTNVHQEPGEALLMIAEISPELADAIAGQHGIAFAAWDSLTEEQRTRVATYRASVARAWVLANRNEALALLHGQTHAA